MVKDQGSNKFVKKGSSLKAIIQQVIERKFNLTQLDFDLFPLINLQLGHIGSDVAQRVAAQLKRSPEEVSRELLDHLAEASGAHVELNQSFVNFVFTAEQYSMIAEARCEPANQNRQMRIFIAPWTDNIQSGEVLRLLGMAFFQLLLLHQQGYALEVQFGEKKLLVQDQFGLIEFFWDQFQILGKQSQGLPADRLGTLIQEFMDRSLYPESAMTCWLAPRSLPRKVFNHLTQQFSNGLTEFCCPQQQLLSDLNLEGWEQLELQHMPALIVYLSSGIPGIDLDLFVPTSSENANTVWFNRTLHTRLLEFSKLPAARGSAVAPQITDDQLRIRLQQFAGFSSYACQRGRVLEFMLAHNELLWQTTAVLNSASVRGVWSRSGLASADRKIITGVLKVLSDMIVLWEPGSHPF